MMEEPQIDPASPEWEAIAKYVADEGTPAERAAVSAMLAGRPADAALVDRLRHVVQRYGDATTDVNTEEALARVRARLGRGAATSSSRPSWAPALRLAAAAVVLVGGGLLLRRPMAERNGTPLASYQTGATETKSVRLEDGTRVILAPLSTLTVDAFGEKRTVSLRGEAYFDVVHDDARPFAVHGAGGVVRDVGTSFTVRAEPEGAERVRVSVRSGSVLLYELAKGEATGVMLHASDRGSLRDNGMVALDRGSVREHDVAWTSGSLDFREAPLGDVVEAIGRWYGVTFRFADTAMARRNVTTTIANEPLDRVMNDLSVMLQATMERTGDTVVVRDRSR